MVNGSKAASHSRSVRLLTEGHNSSFLVISPLKESLDSLLIFELRVVAEPMEHLHVVSLEANHLFEIGEGSLSIHPFFGLSCLLFFARKGDLTENIVASVPGLGIEHGKGEELVLHADVDELRVAIVDDTLIAVLDVEEVGGFQLEGLFEEGEVLLVPSTQDDSIHLSGRAILEGT